MAIVVVSISVPKITEHKATPPIENIAEQTNINPKKMIIFITGSALSQAPLSIFFLILHEYKSLTGFEI
jgi:hypothetical protein